MRHTFHACAFALALLLISSCGSGSDLLSPGAGALSVKAAGLPDGVTASFRVTGPGGFSRTVAGGETLADIPTGEYHVWADTITAEYDLFAPSRRSKAITVRPMRSATVVQHDFNVATGSLTVSAHGLPSGAEAVISLSGPEGFSRRLSGTETLRRLVPGDYEVAASPIEWEDETYVAVPANRQVTVSASEATATATVAYVTASSSLTVEITGLPDVVAGAVLVTGPNGFSQMVSGTVTLTGLLSGTYKLAASKVAGGGEAYAPTPSYQTVTIGRSAAAERPVSYEVVSGVTLNMTVAGMYLTQGSQTYDRAVPLVAGRDGYLRIFVRANEPNTVQPAVRVRIYHSSTLRQTYTIPAPAGSVPLRSERSQLNASWNLAVPGSLIQPGLRILADVDPFGGVAEVNKSDNTFPANGTPLQMDVRAVPPFRVTLVPVRQSANGLTGDVSSANMHEYLAAAMRLFPFPFYDVRVRSPYTTDAPVLQSNNANGAWNTVLSEVNALRVAASDGRHYYGVVRTSYGGGIAGMGYIGRPTAIGFDRSTRSSVAAHEWGHNFGRKHAPCGEPGGTDPLYPYAGGRIGTFGMDLAATQLMDTTLADIMGYCSGRWVSDYTYRGVMEFRGTGSAETAAFTAVDPAVSSAGPSLLIWGRIVDGRVLLEPAFELETRASPPGRGSYRLELLDRAGAVLGSYAFDAFELADGPAGEHHFAFTVPMPAARSRLAALRVRGRAGDVAALTTDAGTTAADGRITSGATAVAQAPDLVAITWDAAAHPMAMIRDARSGEILALARSGNVTIGTRAADVEVVLSSRVLSKRERIPVEGRR